MTRTQTHILRARKRERAHEQHGKGARTRTQTHSLRARKRERAHEQHGKGAKDKNPNSHPKSKAEKNST
jgi:hypothetical protein